MRLNILYWLLEIPIIGAFILLFYIIERIPGNPVIFGLLAFIIIFTAFIYVAVIPPKIIKCPSCGWPLVPYFMIRNTPVMYLAILTLPDKCRSCGHKVP